MFAGIAACDSTERILASCETYGKSTHCHNVNMVIHGPWNPRLYYVWYICIYTDRYILYYIYILGIIVTHEPETHDQPRFGRVSPFYFSKSHSLLISSTLTLGMFQDYENIGTWSNAWFSSLFLQKSCHGNVSRAPMPMASMAGNRGPKVRQMPSLPSCKRSRPPAAFRPRAWPPSRCAQLGDGFSNGCPLGVGRIPTEIIGLNL